MKSIGNEARKLAPALCFSRAVVVVPEVEAEPHGRLVIQFRKAEVVYLPSGLPNVMTIAGVNFGPERAAVDLNDLAQTPWAKRCQAPGLQGVPGLQGPRGAPGISGYGIISALHHHFAAGGGCLSQGILPGGAEGGGWGRMAGGRNALQLPAGDHAWDCKWQNAGGAAVLLGTCVRMRFAHSHQERGPCPSVAGTTIRAGQEGLPGISPCPC
ncbi:MAG: hypothetical protein LC126_02110 [Bryobacterales bacterium]|nr:hypothetical protein [Bryobacterales bacterium]